MSNKAKVLLITGAGRGMGTDIAKAALAAGYKTVATGRDIEKVTEAVGASNDLLVVKLDVTDPSDAQAAVKATVDKFGRIDVLVKAFSRTPQRRLVVIGDGPEMRRLRAMAAPNVELRGRLSGGDVLSHMQRARAFLFAGIEDFGIVIAEAQACGTPVIAFNAGGAAEIVRETTGVLFGEQTPQAVLEALERFEQHPPFASEHCRENALRFERGAFRRRFAEALASHWETFSRARATAPKLP